MSDLLLLHLRSYQILASWSWNEGHMLYKIRPKHHVLWHMAVELPRTRLNPKLFSCEQEESFLGKVKHIARKTHPRTMSWRFMQRYALHMACFLKQEA